MNLERRKVLIWIALLACLILLVMINLTAGGCSKNKDDSAANAAVMDGNTVSGDGEDAASFTEVGEDVRDLICATYAGTGVDIGVIELEDGKHDSARITISFPERTNAQAVLAGFRILRDNFPKLRNYVVKVSGREYECEGKVLTYIASTKGWTIDITEEVAEEYMTIVRNGIPEEDVGKPIRVEAI